jgi:hypothetical protein
MTVILLAKRQYEPRRGKRNGRETAQPRIGWRKAGPLG